jgi:dienelactone hydrolase
MPSTMRSACASPAGVPGRLPSAAARRVTVARQWVSGAAAGAALAVSAVVGVILLGRAAQQPPSGRVTPAAPRNPPVTLPGRAGTPRGHRPFAVGLRTLRLVDRSRRVRQADGRVVARTLVTEVRYPALGAPSGADARGAPAARAAGPFPLVVFGHGFGLLPRTYALLLRAWARAGFVVAAPAFPLERATAPGGPVESDIVNQPGDVRFLISALLRDGAAARGPLHGLLDPQEIAVGGHSDGASTASAVAYDRRERDPRVRAALLFSGAAIDGAFLPRHGSPPLLAVQGTADAVHPPAGTYAAFAAAPRPKYLLRLLGAGHEDPYTIQLPQRRVVERVAVAFLDRYLRHRPDAERVLRAAARAPGIASLTAAP